MNKNTILITGGAGYIGSHTAFLLAQQGYNVVVLDNFIHNQDFAPEWATVIRDDFANAQTLQKVFSTYSIDAVMHFAAFAQVSESVRDPLKYYENNVSKTATLIKTMLAHDVNTIIFSSSCAVYGNPQKLPLTEDHPKNPVSPYGMSKLMVESVFKDCAQAYGLNYVNLRYFNAAGALPEQNLREQHEPETHIIPLVLRAAQTQKPFTIFGADYATPDGTCIRDYLHVLDIAQAHIKALNFLNAGNTPENFNLGTGNGFSVHEIINTIEKVCSIKVPLIVGQKRAGDPPKLVADATKARTMLNWQPQRSDLQTIIQSAFAAQNTHFLPSGTKKEPFQATF